MRNPWHILQKGPLPLHTLCFWLVRGALSSLGGILMGPGGQSPSSLSLLQVFLLLIKFLLLLVTLVLEPTKISTMDCQYLKQQQWIYGVCRHIATCMAKWLLKEKNLLPSLVIVHSLQFFNFYFSLLPFVLCIKAQRQRMRGLHKSWFFLATKNQVKLKMLQFLRTSWAPRSCMPLHNWESVKVSQQLPFAKKRFGNKCIIRHLFLPLVQQQEQQQNHTCTKYETWFCHWWFGVSSCVAETRISWWTKGANRNASASFSFSSAAAAAGLAGSKGGQKRQSKNSQSHSQTQQVVLPVVI